MVLTPRALDALKPAPAGKRYVVWDAMAPHLGVRVTESGSRSFIVVRRRPGQLNPDTHVIGKFPAVELKDARAAVPAILEMLREGKIPREVEAERRRVADTFGAAVADAIAERRKKATGEPMPPWGAARPSPHGAHTARFRSRHRSLHRRACDRPRLARAARPL